jgi:hypothetical protein
LYDADFADVVGSIFVLFVGGFSIGRGVDLKINDVRLEASGSDTNSS